MTVNRVIPFGGTNTTIQDILNAEETREGRFIGIHAVKSKSYNDAHIENFCHAALQKYVP